MNCSKENLLLYAVTDRTWLGEKTLAWQVEQALEGGVTMVQIREKHLSPEAFSTQARELKTLCRRFGVPLIVNDNVDLALELNADGVHVGQEDLEASQARAKLGPNRILGVSAHTVEQALRAQSAGADYLGVGAVFPTGTKSDASVLPFQTLKAICTAVDIPAVAIGGISAQNIHQLAGSGICGVAVVSALFAQPDIRAAAAHLRTLCQNTILL
ncbi:MAG: thiamine phosphate synthase [Lawsonibacter sp.]|jgi:thiamine-phosphate pyrophosphorylase